MSTGLPLLVAWIEFGVIVWLWLSRRNARREIKALLLRARRAELREGPPRPEVEITISSGFHHRHLDDEVAYQATLTDFHTKGAK